MFSEGRRSTVAVNHQHLRAFYAIATEGSFSRAARRLNVAQPTLSQQIKALENRHQAVLFDGRRPPLRLTPVGQELLSLTQRMFATSDEIEQLLDGDWKRTSSLVRIGADSPIYAARLAKALVQERPELSIEVRIDNARETLRNLRDATVDVAIVSDPAVDGQFFYQPLFADNLKVAVSRSHRFARAASFPLSCLKQERLLIREAASKTRAAMDMLLGATGAAVGKVSELHSREAIREAVALGIGVSFFFSSECPPDNRLVFLAPEPQPDGAQLTGYVICRLERRRTPLMRAALAAATTLQGLSPLPLHGVRGREAAADEIFAPPPVRVLDFG